MPDGRGWPGFLAAVPKVELHVHLEGAMQPGTLLALARRRSIDLPARDAAGLRRWFEFRDFDHFVEVYLACSSCLRDPEDFQLLIRDFMAEQERQNVLYTEAHFTVSTHLANGANGAEIADAMRQEIVANERRRGVGLRLIPDIVRNLGGPQADETLAWALEHRAGLVVALGLSGKESSPTEPFAEHFEEAARRGLNRTVHAGEQAGPEVIRAALELCGAERIGHGIRALDDPDLVAELAARGIPFEVCPTSNVRLGFVPEPAAHPLAALAAAGVELSVNSDDPALFGTSLTDEYALAADLLDLDHDGVGRLARAALEQAFVEPSERRALESRFDSELAAACERAAL